MERRWIAAVMLVGCAGARAPSGDDHPAAGEADAGNQGMEACAAPDMLILLDRTMSMSKRPDGSTPPNTVAGRQQTKWSIAITAVEALTNQFQAGLRFGLALFPRDPGGGACITLAQKLSGKGASNPDCQAGELLASPAPSAGSMIGTLLDPETTTLCTSTPIGAGLDTARSVLAGITDHARDQYVLFVGDGKDTCDDALALVNTQLLAAGGVRTFVVAFDSSSDGIDNGQLNDMACAGRTATGFPASCKPDGMGHYTATNRSGPPLYLVAENAAALSGAFAMVAGSVCCGCTM